MRKSQRWVAAKTLLVAFAVLLTPMLMGQEGQCPPGGDSSLALLDLVAAGESLIAFEREVETYQATLPRGVDQVTLIAEATEWSAAVMYELHEACPPPQVFGDLPDGGGEITFEEWPAGHNVLKVCVDSVAGDMRCYQIIVTSAVVCE